MDAANRYEEEARQFLGKVRGMKLLIVRYEREAKGKMDLASFYHRMGQQLMDEMKKGSSATSHGSIPHQPAQHSNP